jgi:DNA-binding response OmpR family regulator
MDWTAPRILVIAAEPALRFTIEELLRAYGYDVTTAPSSAAALHLDAEGRCAAMHVDSTLLALPALDRLPPALVKPHDGLERWPFEEYIPL